MIHPKRIREGHVNSIIRMLLPMVAKIVISSLSLHAKDTWFKAAEMKIRKGADRKLKLETTRREIIGNDSGHETTNLAKIVKYKKVMGWHYRGRCLSGADRRRYLERDIR